MTLLFWFQFAAVCIAGAMSPGPSLALIIRNSTKYNRLSGIMSAVGHGLGMGVYAIFAVTGLSIILTTNIYIFKSIQIAGITLLFIYGILFFYTRIFYFYSQSQNINMVFSCIFSICYRWLNFTN